MNTAWTGIYTCKECHKTGSRWNHITTDHKEGEQLEDRRNVCENSCVSGDGTDQTGPILDVYDDDDYTRPKISLTHNTSTEKKLQITLPTTAYTRSSVTSFLTYGVNNGLRTSVIRTGTWFTENFALSGTVQTCLHTTRELYKVWSPHSCEH